MFTTIHPWTPSISKFSSTRSRTKLEIVVLAQSKSFRPRHLAVTTKQTAIDWGFRSDRPCVGRVFKCHSNPWPMTYDLWPMAYCTDLRCELSSAKQVTALPSCASPYSNISPPVSMSHSLITYTPHRSNIRSNTQQVGPVSTTLARRLSWYFEISWTFGGSFLSSYLLADIHTKTPELLHHFLASRR